MATIPDPKSPLWVDPFELLKEGLPIKKTSALTYLNQCWTKNVEHILKNKEPTDNIPYYWATNRGKGTLIIDNALKTTNGTAGKYLYLSKKDAKDIFSEKYHMESAPIFMDRISIKKDIVIKANGKYSIVSEREVVITPAKTNTKKGKQLDIDNNNVDNDSNYSLFLSGIGSPDLIGESSKKSPLKGILKTPTKKASPAQKATSTKKASPAQKASPAKKATSAQKATSAKKATSAQKTSPAQKDKEPISSDEEDEEEAGTSNTINEKPGRGRPRLAKKHKYIRDQWAKTRKRKKTKREYLTKWQRNNNPAPDREYTYNLTPKFAMREIVSARHPDTHAYHKAIIIKQHKDANGNFNRVYAVEWEDKTITNISQQCIKASPED